MIFDPCVLVRDNVWMAKPFQRIDLVEHSHEPAVVVPFDYSTANTDWDLLHCVHAKLHIVQHVLTEISRGYRLTK